MYWRLFGGICWVVTERICHKWLPQMVSKDCELNIFQSYIESPREPSAARALDASSKQCLILGLRQSTRAGTNGCGARSENCRGAQPLPEQSPHPGDARYALRASARLPNKQQCRSARHSKSACPVRAEDEAARLSRSFAFQHRRPRTGLGA